MSYKKKLKKAVKYLTKYPKKIQEAWSDPELARGGILFGFVAEDKFQDQLCLTQIRLNTLKAYVGLSIIGTSNVGTRPAIEAIKKDEKIPQNSDEIEVEHLPRFAKYQLAFHKYKKHKDFEKLMRKLKKIRHE